MTESKIAWPEDPIAAQAVRDRMRLVVSTLSNAKEMMRVAIRRDADVNLVVDLDGHHLRGAWVEVMTFVPSAVAVEVDSRLLTVPRLPEVVDPPELPCGGTQAATDLIRDAGLLANRVLAALASSSVRLPDGSVEWREPRLDDARAVCRAFLRDREATR